MSGVIPSEYSSNNQAVDVSATIDTATMEVVREGAWTVAPMPTKSPWSTYRSGIVAADVPSYTSIVNVTNANACSVAYHPTSVSPVTPISCTQSVLYIRALTDTDADIVVHPILFHSDGGGGCFPYSQRSITLSGTGMQVGSLYATDFAQIDVGPDNQAHFFVSALGGAGSANIEFRNG